MKRLTAYILLLTAYLFTSCGAEQQYTSWSCRFIFNNGYYLDQTIAVAINPTVSGIFCKVTEETRAAHATWSSRTATGRHHATR